MGAKMTFTCISLSFFIAQLYSIFEQSGGTRIKKCFDEFILCRMELLPGFLQWNLIYVSQNNAAASTTEDIAEWVNMHTFCA